MRILRHPVLPNRDGDVTIKIDVDGEFIDAVEGEPIAAALLANGIRAFRKTHKRNEPRGVFCGIGRCTDCMMIVDGVPNVRTCVTPVKAGMRVETQVGFGEGSGKS